MQPIPTITKAPGPRHSWHGSRTSQNIINRLHAICGNESRINNSFYGRELSSAWYLSELALLVVVPCWIFRGMRPFYKYSMCGSCSDTVQRGLSAHWRSRVRVFGQSYYQTPDAENTPLGMGLASNLRVPLLWHAHKQHSNYNMGVPKQPFFVKKQCLNLGH